jgi:hypothetical protein
VAHYRIVLVSLLGLTIWWTAPAAAQTFEPIPPVHLELSEAELDEFAEEAAFADEISFQQPAPARPSRPAPRRAGASAVGASAVGAASATAVVSVASIPFMIGDTVAGSCASVSFLGALDGIIEHPTLSCSRLNISENNTAITQDRVYVSYRHFHNASRTKIFSLENDLNIDRVTFGAEVTGADGLFSVELRVPVSREMASNFDIILNDFDPSVQTVPLRDRDGEFGNIATILKVLLADSEEFALSCGVAVNAPTADDVIANGDFFSFFEVVSPSLLFAFADVDFRVLVQNETWNISPFLAWAWAPTSRFFHHGFFQVDVPTNRSGAAINVNGLVQPFTFLGPLAAIPVDVNEVGEFSQQTLMRLNVGGGYWLYQDPEASLLNGVAAMLELHYTSPLQDATILRRNLFSYDFPPGTPLPVDIALGNGANRIDVVNLAVGNAVVMGQTTITNGVILPLREGENRGFDMEYNLQVQRRY